MVVRNRLVFGVISALVLVGSPCFAEDNDSISLDHYYRFMSFAALEQHVFFCSKQIPELADALNAGFAAWRSRHSNDLTQSEFAAKQMHEDRGASLVSLISTMRQSVAEHYQSASEEQIQRSCSTVARVFGDA